LIEGAKVCKYIDIYIYIAIFFVFGFYLLVQ